MLHVTLCDLIITKIVERLYGTYEIEGNQLVWELEECGCFPKYMDAFYSFPNPLRDGIYSSPPVINYAYRRNVSTCDPRTAIILYTF